MYNNKSYTGNIYGINLDKDGNRQERMLRGYKPEKCAVLMKSSCKTGRWPVGGDGSAIIPWSTKEEEDMPQHRYSGVYWLMTPCGCTRP